MKLITSAAFLLRYAPCYPRLPESGPWCPSHNKPWHLKFPGGSSNNPVEILFFPGSWRIALPSWSLLQFPMKRFWLPSVTSHAGEVTQSKNLHRISPSSFLKATHTASTGEAGTITSLFLLLFPLLFNAHPCCQQNFSTFNSIQNPVIAAGHLQQHKEEELGLQGWCLSSQPQNCLIRKWGESHCRTEALWGNRGTPLFPFRC